MRVNVRVDLVGRFALLTKSYITASIIVGDFCERWFFLNKKSIYLRKKQINCSSDYSSKSLIT